MHYMNNKYNDAV